MLMGINPLKEKCRLDVQFIQFHVLACNVVNTNRIVVNFFLRKFLLKLVMLILTDKIKRPRRI